jgi:hypothetical protein
MDAERRMPKQARSSPKWVSNQEANEIVEKAKAALRAGNKNDPVIRQLMSLIVGVSNYNAGNHKLQGMIRRIYNSEKRSQYSADLSNNFGIDFDDAIAAFWEAVFNKLPMAETTGTIVNVRVVDGQDSSGELISAGSITTARRATKCNPINYLKHYGWLGIRNMLNKAYRKHILQLCDDCGSSSSVSTAEKDGIACPKCSSVNTIKCWPSGNSSYRSRKARKCTDCNFMWDRQFARICIACGSDNVRTDSLIVSNEEHTLHQESTEATADEAIEAQQSDEEFNNLLNDIYKSLPKDPVNPTSVTHTHDVFNLLTRPAASVDMCKACVASAPLVCSKKCRKSICVHNKIPDPAISCGAESMATSQKCVNYSKKIGEYHGVSASLASRRVKKVRKYVIQYIRTNHKSKSLDNIYDLLERKGIL